MGLPLATGVYPLPETTFLGFDVTAGPAATNTLTITSPDGIVFVAVEIDAGGQANVNVTNGPTYPAGNYTVAITGSFTGTINTV